MSEGSVIPARRRLVSVDALRGLAALAVTVTHVPHTHGNSIGWEYFLLLPLDFGSMGVPLFLVLSGFCIHLGTARGLAEGRAIRSAWLPFWKRRFFRLYPPYAVAMVVSLLIWSYVDPDRARPYFAEASQFGCDLAAHVFMFHNLTRDFWNGLANAPFWSLGLEEQLYGLFFVMLLLRRKCSPLRVLGISLFVTAVWRMGWPLLGWCLWHRGQIPRADQVIAAGPYVWGNWTMWPFGWWFLWVLGAVAAEAWYGLVRLPNWCYSRVAIAGFGIFSLVAGKSILGRFTQFWILDEGPRGVLKMALEMVVSLAEPAFAVASFVLLNRWLRAERAGTFRGPVTGGLARVGLFSYSLYLIHVPVIKLLGALCPSVDAAGLLPRLLLEVPGCLAAAWLFFHAVERHFLGQTVHAPSNPAATN